MPFQPLQIKSTNSETSVKPTPSFVPLGSPVPPKSNFLTDWLGVKNPDTYVQDYSNTLKENVQNPVQSGIDTLKAGAQGAIEPVKNVVGAYKQLSQDAKGNSLSSVIADTLKLGTAGAGVLFSPINAVFSAAQKTPLKPAADLLQAPFAVTGKIGGFAGDKFTDVLPISQEAKDILKPAFNEVGTLAGQILLGGKVLEKVMGGGKVDQKTVDTLKEETKTQVASTEVKPTPSFEPLPTPNAEPLAPVSPKIAPESTITPTVDNIPKDLQPLAQEARQYGVKIDLNNIGKANNEIDMMMRYLNDKPQEALKSIGIDSKAVGAGGNADFIQRRLLEIKTAINKTTDPLIAEARKYKSAEEFVKAQTPMSQFTEKGKAGEFWTTPEGADSGYGTIRKDAYIDLNSPKVFKGFSSLDYIKENGLLTPQIQKTIDAAAESNNPNMEYKIPQDIAKADLQKKGYSAALWSYEDDLNPTQYQIWDKSIVQTKSQLTDIWNKANGAQPMVETGRVTKTASDINQELVKRGFDSLPIEEQSKYTPQSYSQIANDVASLMDNSIQDAIDMATGKKPLSPEMQRNPEILFNAVEAHAIEKGDVQTLKDLAKSPVSRTSQAGQILGGHGFNDNPNSPVKMIDELNTEYKTRIEKKTGKKYSQVEKPVIDEAKSAKDSVKTTKQSWSDFINEIKCNY